MICLVFFNTPANRHLASSFPLFFTGSEVKFSLQNKQKYLYLGDKILPFQEIDSLGKHKKSKDETFLAMGFRDYIVRGNHFIFSGNIYPYR